MFKIHLTTTCSKSYQYTHIHIHIIFTHSSHLNCIYSLFCVFINKKSTAFVLVFSHILLIIKCKFLNFYNTSPQLEVNYIKVLNFLNKLLVIKVIERKEKIYIFSFFSFKLINETIIKTKCLCYYL